MPAKKKTTPAAAIPATGLAKASIKSATGKSKVSPTRASILTPLAASNFLQPFEVPALIRYFQSVQVRFGNIRVLNVATYKEDRKDVHIDDLFIQPALSENPISLSEASKEAYCGVDLLTVLRENPRLVILGDPGSGKSTITNWIAWSLTSSESHRPVNHMLKGFVPVPIVLREAQVPDFDPKGMPTMKEIFNVFLSQNFTQPLEGRTDLLEDLFERGQLFFLIDGIDELTTAKVDWLRLAWLRLAITKTASPSRALLTSRIVGYDPNGFEEYQNDRTGQAKQRKGKIPSLESKLWPCYRSILASARPDSGDLPREIDSFVLADSPVRRYVAPFDHPRIREYSRNWYGLRIGSPAEAAKTASDFLKAVAEHPALSELRHSPLLLTFMAIVFQVRDRLPDGRALLYREITDAYLDKLRIRKAALDAVTSDDVRIALFRLAWEAQKKRDESEKSRRIPDEGILLPESLVRKVFEEALNSGRHEAGEEYVTALLEDCKLRTGLLVPRGIPKGAKEEHYSFAHLSFQEYFASQNLLLHLGNDWSHWEHEMEGFSRADLAVLSSRVTWRETFLLVFESLSEQVSALNPATFAGYLFDARMEKTGRTGFGKVSWSRQPGDLILHPPPKISERSSVFDPNFVQARHRLSLLVSIAGDSRVRFSPELRDAIVKALLPLLALADLIEAPIYTQTIAAAIIASPLLKDRFFALLPNFVSNGAVRDLNLRFASLANLSPLSNLFELESLDLSHTPIADLSPLSKLSALKFLSVSGTSVSDLSPLTRLSALESLNLANSSVGDISLLAKLRGLKSVNLYGTQVGDFSPLSKLPLLESLTIGENRDIQLASLRKLIALKKLSIFHTPISDLSPLVSLSKLETLELFDTEVTDLSPLHSLTTLTRLWYHPSPAKRVLPQIAALKKALPKLEIVEH